MAPDCASGHDGPGLPQSQARAPIAAIPGLVPAYEAASISRRVAPLTFQVIAPAPEIEPDDRVLGTMAFRLGYIAERCKGLRHRAVRRTRNDGQKRSGTAVEFYPHLVPACFVNPRLVHRGTHYPDIEHTMPFSHACQDATTSHRPVRSRRDHIEGHGEYDIDEYQQSANEPCRTTAIRNEGRRHGSNHHHRHRTRPKLQVHWLGPEDVAQAQKNR